MRRVMRRVYSNPDPAHRPHGARAILRWGLLDPLTGRRRAAAPGPPAPRVEPDLASLRERSDRPRLTWIGHSSFLASLGGRSFLIDPVFSRRVGWAYRRHGEPGLEPSELPPLSAILVSHNHYDHLDYASLRALPRQATAVVPRGLGRWFRRWNRRPLVELDWWQTVTLDGLEITLVPSRHWSRRWIFDTNRVLWGGFVVRCGGDRIYHAGDSAWFDGFAEIGRRHPDLLAALLPIGGYEPGWFMENNHLTPEQAGRAFLALGARRLVPMHWGAFQLTDEPLSAPLARLSEWWRREGPRDGRALAVPAVGETLDLGREREARGSAAGGRG